MMAFYTEYTENGQKRFQPTKELRDLLSQDRVTDKDLQVFRSSNRVEQLLRKIFQDRGFEYSHSNREWVRFASKKKALVSHLADTLNQVFTHKMVQSRQVLHKVSVAQKVDEAVNQFMTKMGQHPNKLWISDEDWYELASHIALYDLPSYGVHTLPPSIYLGMKVELIPNGKSLFVGIAADGATNVGDEVTYKVFGDEVTYNEEGKVTGKVFFGENSGGSSCANPTSEVFFGGQQAGKTQKALEEAFKRGVKAAGKNFEQAPLSGKKRITPPSQLKRKLAI
jgi:hypothetical protein